MAEKLAGDATLIPFVPPEATGIKPVEARLAAKLREIESSSQPEVHAATLRITEDPAFNNFSISFRLCLLDFILQHNSIESVSSLASCLIDTQIKYNPLLSTLNYGHSWCAVGLMWYGVSFAEIERILPEIVSIEVELIELEFLTPSHTILGTPPDVERYAQLLHRLTTKEIADLLGDNSEKLLRLPFYQRNALLKNLAADLDPASCNRKIQLLSSVQTEIIDNNSRTMESLLVADMVKKAITAPQLESLLTAILSEQYMTLNAEYRSEMRKNLVDALEIESVLFIIDVLPRTNLISFPKSIVSTILSRYKLKQDQSEVLQMIELYQLDELVAVWENSEYTMAAVITACGCIDNVDQLRKALVLTEYCSDLESKDIDNIFEELLPQLLSLELSEAYSAIEKILQIHTGNAIPLFVKQFLIFEVLYFPKNTKFRDTSFYRELKGKGKGARLSPLLSSISQRVIEQLELSSNRLTTADIIKQVFWKDLLHISIDSADQSLATFLNSISLGQSLVDKAYPAGFEQLSEAERAQLSHFFDTLAVIAHDFQSRSDQRSEDATSTTSDSLDARHSALLEQFNVQPGGRFVDTIVTRYLETSGYADIPAILARMSEVKNLAHQRNLTNEYMSVGKFVPHEGDLMKTVEFETLSHVLTGGFRSREFLGSVGSSVGSDKTPFDADFWRLREGDAPLAHFDSKYGRISCVVKNRGQFAEQVLPTGKSRDNNLGHQYELIHSNRLGSRHYGVRTGIPSTEIDAILIHSELDSSELSQLFFEIANNGFYIPVYNEDGAVIFTLNEYQSYRIDADQVRAATSAEDFHQDQLVAALGSSPYLQYLFALSSGVGEGYSLKTHTMMVMQQFEKYFAPTYTSDVLTIDNFRLLLALHDIGKSKAHAEKKKIDQHRYTKEILQFALPTCDVESLQASKIIALIDQDVIGDYFKGNLKPEAAILEIQHIASLLKASMSETLQLLRIFYISDAGSYTADASGNEYNNLGHIFNFTTTEGGASAAFSEDFQEMFDELVFSIESSSQ